MYIDVVPNRHSPPAILLREGYRDGSKVKKRTLANLSHWPPQLVEHFRVLLKGGVAVAAVDEVLTIERSLPHGHVAAVLGTARACGLERWFDPAPARLRPLLLAMVAARLLEPASKLATWRSLDPRSATTSLSAVLGLTEMRPEALYEALDWLGAHQAAIEAKLARKHLADGVLVLYDLTSTWVTGGCCDLAAFGYSRDGKRDCPQIVFGLLCTAEGCPVAVEVFSGNTADASTVAAQVDKLKQRFGLTRVVWVGDRGMLTQTQIDTVLKPGGMSWITALRAPQIAALADAKGPFQPSLFDERGFLEIEAPAYPGERLVVCRNPLLAEERARKRDALLAATEQELDRIVHATQRPRAPLHGQAKIALRVGRVIDRFHMAKHFTLDIGETQFRYARQTEAIAREAALDGLYVVRTDVPHTELDARQTVLAYKGLSQVERAFRAMKTVDLNVRPIFHWTADRVRAHVFLCLLAYYVEWHMRQALKPLLFDDEELPTARDQRADPVAPSPTSAKAERKQASALTEFGEPAHSFRTLLADLATVCYNVATTPAHPDAKLLLTTRPTPLQARAFALLGIRPECSQ
jgi:Transposase DDE domain